MPPDTPNTPPPPLPPRPGKVAPECVNKMLEAVYTAEKDHFAKTKSYSNSMLEIHAASKIGIGCSGWDLPDIQVTYGGAGFTATSTEASSDVKWTINQDHSLTVTEKEIKPLPPPEPAPKKK
ncbi:MAG: hypothetical protein ACXWP1_11950 [Bdellovibrionota bacterium]